MSKNNGSAVTREEAVALTELVKVVAVVAAVEVPEPVVITIVKPASISSPETLNG